MRAITRASTRKLAVRACGFILSTAAEAATATTGRAFREVGTGEREDLNYVRASLYLKHSRLKITTPLVFGSHPSRVARLVSSREMEQGEQLPSLSLGNFYVLMSDALTSEPLHQVAALRPSAECIISSSRARVSPSCDASSRLDSSCQPPSSLCVMFQDPRPARLSNQFDECQDERRPAKV